MGSIYLDDSSAIIHHNLINGWLSGAGMIIRNDSSPNIYLYHIYGKDYSIGIKLDGNILMTPILDRNKVHVGNNGTCVDLIGYAPSIIDNEFYARIEQNQE